MMRIIDHKRIDLTDQEWNTYLNICKNYDDGVSRKGSDLFCDLFETDENGIIIFLKPPSRQTSWEILFFLMNIMEHQHLRLIHKQVDDVCQQITEQLNELKKTQNNK